MRNGGSHISSPCQLVSYCWQGARGLVKISGMPTTSPNRRSLLKGAALSAAALSAPAILRGADAPPAGKLKLGIIGCGGRGKFIGDIFRENGSAQIVALHDFFKDRVDEAGQRYDVPAERRFTGLDGYLKLLDSGIDAVAIESPPCFHPEQAMAAVERGKHVYLAKPVATDVAGALMVSEAAKKAAEKGLNFLVDFQTRANEFYQGAADAVHAGAIGTPIIGQAFYYASRLGPQADPKSTSPEARLRNWVFDKALSGDIIVEQNIHVLDVANWFLKGHPLKATGSGGRKGRVDVGDAWDHFSVIYSYPNEAIIDFSSAQFTTGFSDLCVRICGSTGTVESHYGGQVIVRAKQGSYKGGQTAQIYKAGAAENIKNFCAAILTKGKPINSGESGVESTLTAIMGRTAAYTGKTVTWEEMIGSKEKVDLKLNLSPGSAEWKG